MKNIKNDVSKFNYPVNLKTFNDFSNHNEILLNNKCIQESLNFDPINYQFENPNIQHESKIFEKQKRSYFNQNNLEVKDFFLDNENLNYDLLQNTDHLDILNEKSKM